MWSDPCREPASAVILGIETSCDETAAAVVTDDGRDPRRTSSPRRPSCTRATAASCPRSPRGGTSSSSRRSCARRSARPARRSTTSTRVAVTQGPGLIGALLVGLVGGEGARLGAAAAARAGRPPARPRRLALPRSPTPLEPPFLCLLASGGHTLLARRARSTARFASLGTTLDDAAGEAFDKGARLLGLGYPGGAEIDRLAREGDPEAFDFPVARVPGLDFSFSGLKTALLYAVRDLARDELEARRADLAATLPAGDRPRARRADAEAAEQTGRRADRGRRRRRRELRAPRGARRTPRSRRSRSAPTTRR